LLHIRVQDVKQKQAGAVFERSGRDGGKAVDKRVLCEQNPKQELYKEVQFLPVSDFQLEF